MSNPYQKSFYYITAGLRERYVEMAAKSGNSEVSATIDLFITTSICEIIELLEKRTSYELRVKVSKETGAASVGVTR